MPWLPLSAADRVAVIVNLQSKLDSGRHGAPQPPARPHLSYSRTPCERQSCWKLQAALSLVRTAAGGPGRCWPCPFQSGSPLIDCPVRITPVPFAPSIPTIFAQSVKVYTAQVGRPASGGGVHLFQPVSSKASSHLLANAAVFSRRAPVPPSLPSSLPQCLLGRLCDEEAREERCPAVPETNTPIGLAAA